MRLKGRIGWNLGVCVILAAGQGLALAEPKAGGKSQSPEKAFEADKGAATLDVSGYPKGMQEIYPLFQKKCSQCHTLARPINSTLAGEDWRFYVKQMRRKPDSKISKAEANKLIKFLQFHSEQNRGAKKDGQGSSKEKNPLKENIPPGEGGKAPSPAEEPGR